MASQDEPKTPDHGETSNEEEEEVDWEVGGKEEEEARAALGVMGKIWTDRNINVNALIATMKKIWNPKHGMEANCIEKKRVFLLISPLEGQGICDGGSTMAF